jgi:hypothetical protein
VRCRLRLRASPTQGGWELVSARARPRRVSGALSTVSSTAGFGVVRGDTGGSRGSVGSGPQGSGGDICSQRPGERGPAVGICTLTAPTRGGLVDGVQPSPPTADGVGRRTLGSRDGRRLQRESSSRCELGRGRTCRLPVAAHQLRPTGGASRGARSRLAGNLAPRGGALRGFRSVEVDVARRGDLGAVALVLRTSVRGAGSSVTGRLQSGMVGSTQARWRHRNCTRVRFAAHFLRLFTWTLYGRD